MKSLNKIHSQYKVEPNVFDAYNKDTPVQIALGSERQSSKREQSDIRSVNWVPGVSGWRLTPIGLELGASSGVFPPGTITFTDIQNIATDRILGRDTASSGVIEELTVGAGLLITGGALTNTITQYTDELAQDAIGGMVSGEFVYTDATPLLGLSYKFTYVAVTATYPILTTDYTVNCTSGTFTATLPTAVGVTGKVYNIKNSGTGVITINTTSSQTIDGNASGTLTLNQYDNLQVQSDGANWIIL